jgi:hypothetical protein
MTKDQLRNLLSVTSPSFLYYVFDALAAALAAWLLPDGVNRASKLFRTGFALSDGPGARAAAFFCTFLFLYGLQITRWARDIVSNVTGTLPDQATAAAAAATMNSVDASISRSIIRLLIPSAETDSTAAHRNLEILSDYATHLGEMPPWLIPIADQFSRRHMDLWLAEMNQLQHGGLQLDLEDQIHIVKLLAEHCREYILVDPVIYHDVHIEWTPAWRGFLNWSRDQPHIVKHYIVTPPMQQLSGQAQQDLTVLSEYLQRHGFTVWLCDQASIKDVNPDTPFLNQLFHIYDDRLFVSMISQLQYTGAKKVPTIVGKIDSQLAKYIGNLNHYRRLLGSPLLSGKQSQTSHTAKLETAQWSPYDSPQSIDE